ncbi:MAG TPA: hypothetical protein VGO52_25545 [Hyphomonadaceae bacterium]|jgi:hypothetical protein|nr:hypothetical protein [Hyphomonadaceae bacterium]
MRKFIIAVIAALSVALPAHAQLDPNKPEDQFRAYSALAGGGVRCKITDELDTDVAHQFADQMAGADEKNKAALNQIYAAAKSVDCADPQLSELFKLAAKLVAPTADGWALAFVDQRACKASERMATVRLYSAYRVAGMSEARKTAGASARKDMRDLLKVGCEKTSDDLGIAYLEVNSIGAWNYKNQNGSCLSGWAKWAGPFDCVYGKPPPGPKAYKDEVRFGRQSLRAAKAKAVALELNTSKSCAALTAAERAAGEAQMKADAALGIAKYNKKTKTLAAKLDGDTAYATADAAVLAGRAAAKTAACDDLAKPAPAASPDEPEATQGEAVSPASGAARIRETLDRTALMAVSMQACEALPNFAATKKSAEAYIATVPQPRRLAAQAEAEPFLTELDRKGCKADALGAAFKATPLYAVDALNGAWK